MFFSFHIFTQAVIENIVLKQQIFSDLEKYCRPDCILASNTSTIDLNVIGERTKSRDRIVGAHFFRWKCHNVLEVCFSFMSYCYLYWWYTVQPCSCHATSGSCSDTKNFASSNCWFTGYRQENPENPNFGWKLHWFCCQPDGFPLLSVSIPVSWSWFGSLPNWSGNCKIWNANGSFQVHYLFISPTLLCVLFIQFSLFTLDI